MTGWRIGWMVVPEDQVRRVERLAQNMFICPPHASQVAALAALDCTATSWRPTARSMPRTAA
jgi:aspartate/methionine/tyrosine aminotransferase